MAAETEEKAALRVVFWRIDLEAQGPGLALRDMLAGDVLAQSKAKVLAYLAPDILVLSGLDYDHGLRALMAFRDILTGQGHEMAHVLAFPSNAGLRTGRDMTGDGRDFTPDDTQGYGQFRGERALALLSRLPIDHMGARDFTDFLWRDLPDANLPDLPAEVLKLQRLSSTGHWDIPVVLDGGARLHLLIYQAGPPVFGNHPTRNRLRNHDETAFWGAFLDGRLPMPPPMRLLCFWVAAILTPMMAMGCMLRCKHFWPILPCKTQNPPVWGQSWRQRVSAPNILARMLWTRCVGWKGRAICG